MRNPIVMVFAIVISLIAVYVIIVTAMIITKYIKEGPRPAEMPYSHRCIIHVTQDGVPLEGATVTLWPTDENLSLWGQILGTTDAKGNARIKVEGIGNYDGAFRGDYKVTISKNEASKDKDLQFIRLVDPQYCDLHTTPLDLTVKRSAKTKIDVGPAVRVEVKTLEAEQKDKVLALLANAQPCQITILQDGKPVPNAEITLEGKSRQYSHLWVEFKGTTDAQGVASIAAVPTLGSMRGTNIYPEGLPVETFEVKVKIWGAEDFGLRVGKKLGSITVSDQPIVKKYDLNKPQNKR